MVHLLVHLHYACFVSAAVAVVGRRKDGDDGLVVAPVEAVHHKLVSTCNQLQVVGVIEVLGYVLAERKASTSRRDSPTMPVVGV